MDTTSGLVADDTNDLDKRNRTHDENDYKRKRGRVNQRQIHLDAGLQAHWRLVSLQGDRILGFHGVLNGRLETCDEDRFMVVPL